MKTHEKLLRMEDIKYSTQEACPLKYHEELSPIHEDRYIRFLHRLIRLSVKILALLMVLVILWGIGDVIYVLYTRLIKPPFLLLQIQDILDTFGAFMAVLIAIEIFINIRLYLESNILPIRLVIATALMAIARKVIIMDYTQLNYQYIYGTGAVVFALGIAYYLIVKAHKE